MQISLNWLNDYVDLSDLSATEVGRTLTDIGLAVDAVATQSKIPATVVTGKVLTAVKHPNADSLQVCTVDVGTANPAGPLTIVCGAPNARPDIFVAVALVGTDLGGGFKIKEAKIRGEKSCGMMCSEKELGLSDAHGGIIELSGNPALGTAVAGILGKGDTVFTLDITSNRGDCLSHIGVARDLAAKLKRPLKLPNTANKNNSNQASTLLTKGHVRTESTNSDACARFTAIYVRDVPSSVASPAWLSQRLEAAGMRPLNLVVDVTNYVMLEYGQPVHAYDERDIQADTAGCRTLIARLANAGETITTLDGQTRKLTTDDLVIADSKRAVGIAGIMGGANSEIKPDTKNIIVEVAWFHPQVIRKTAKRLGLRSEASHRFERSVDIAGCAVVARRVADLLVQCVQELNQSQNDPAKKLTTPLVAADVVDFYPQPPSPSVITLRMTRAREFLAMPALKKDTVREILTGLQFRLLDSNEERLVFEVPTWRHDVEREVDLIEEIARQTGLDKIPYTLPVMSIRPTVEDLFIDFTELARVTMAARGLRETISFPFIARKDLEACQLTPEHPFWSQVVLANPLSEEQGFMQTSLVPNLIRAVVANSNHGQKAVRLFECGRGYYQLKSTNLERWPLLRNWARPGRHYTERARSDAGRPVERHLIAAILGQPVSQQAWNQKELAATFFHGKETLAAWLGSFGVHGVTFSTLPGETFPWMHPRASAAVLFKDQFLGYVGEIHPSAAIAFGLTADQAPIVFECDLEAVFAARSRAATTSTTMWRFPPASRDIAMMVEHATTYADFEAAVAKFPKRKNLQRMALFDVYSGANLPAGKKSMAFTVDFQSPERTLTDQEVETELTSLVAWLTDNLGAVQR